MRHRTSAKLTAWILTALLLAAMLTLDVPKTEAHDAVNSISISVGFWGDTGYVKKEVSLSELASACGTHREIYTWINAGDSPGTTEAEGIYLYDILDYCGINSGAVYTYNFYTTDAGTYANSNQQWTNSQLFGTRYTYRACFETALEDYNQDREDYLKNPEGHYTVDNIFDFSGKKYTDDAWNNREAVEPMLALKTKSSNWKGYTPASGLDFSGMDANGRPILVFGQTGRNDITRNLMAQMVTKVHIWYDGSPTITFEADELDGEIGEAGTYQVTVSTPDSFLSEKVLENLKVESSDSSVAEVLDDGTIRITGEGTAEITASYGGKVYGKVTATGKKPEEPEEPEVPADGSGTGTGTTTGEGTGSSTGANTGTGTGTGSVDKDAKGSGSSSSSTKDTPKNTPRKPQNSGSHSVTTQKPATVTQSGTKPDTAQQQAATQQGSSGGAASGSGNSNIKVYEISAADDVYVESVIDERVRIAVWIAAILALIAGASAETWYYRGQIHWVQQAQKAYKKYE
ncbi:MAG: hypothetical protein IJH77_03975 [Mogibacterium sp.]|nr:hypothetical protein [Mogibacterium sp.]